jgi:COP9 signalosome complex subunit 1
MDVESDNQLPFDLEVSNMPAKSHKNPHLYQNSSSKTIFSYHSTPPLQAYISNYHGEVKIDRLIAIADVYGRSPLAITALTSAVAELRATTQDTSRYLSLIDRLSQLGQSHPIDREWIDSTDQAASSLFATIDSDLNQAKSSMDKTAIRAGYKALADHCFIRGDFQGAFKNYLRTRDYGSDTSDTSQSCLAVLRGSIITKSYAHIGNYVGRVDQFPDMRMLKNGGRGMDIEQKPGGGAGGALSRMMYALNDKIAATAGLAQLAHGRFLAAGRYFTSISPDLIDELSPHDTTTTNNNNNNANTEQEAEDGQGQGEEGRTWSRLLAPRDVAVYGVICALASFDRGELRTRILESPIFAPYLDTVPQIKEAVHNFYNHKFTASLGALDALLPLLRADIHLQQHLATLYQDIRWKAMRDYTAPFSSLDLNTMAVEFGCRDVGGIEKELAVLISGGKIQARIDSHAKVLYAFKKDARSEMYGAAVEAAEGHVRDGKALLLRVSMVKNDLVQRRGGGGGVGGGMMALPDRGEREMRGGRHRERGGGGGGGGGGRERGERDRERGGEEMEIIGDVVMEMGGRM